MHPSTLRAVPTPEGPLSKPRGDDSHLNPNTTTGPIAHRPPGRLSYQEGVPVLDQESFEASNSQSFDTPTISNTMKPSLDPSRAIHNDYSPSSFHPHFSHQNHHIFTPTSDSTPDAPSFRDPRNGAPEYGDNSFGMWYSNTHNSAPDLSRTRGWSRQDQNAQENPSPLSNIPRIYVDSQENSSDTPITYPSNHFLGPSAHSSNPHNFTPSSQASPGALTLRIDEYPRYQSTNPDSAASRRNGVDTLSATLSLQSNNSFTRQPRGTMSVPILRLDTTGLDHVGTGTRGSPPVSNLAGYPRSGLTSPLEAPSPNPASASSNPSPNSSTSSAMNSPSPGSSPMTFVPFQPGLNAQVVHVISEDKSITDSALRDVFPPSSQCPPVPSSPQSQPARKWICQWPACGKSVRRQDRVAHALEHHGRKRFACSCGGSFARSQDKKRHLREQAICLHCPRSVGRNGYRGVCPACAQEHNNRDESAGATFKS